MPRVMSRVHCMMVATTTALHGAPPAPPRGPCYRCQIGHERHDDEPENDELGPGEREPQEEARGAGGDREDQPHRRGQGGGARTRGSRTGYSIMLLHRRRSRVPAIRI